MKSRIKIAVTPLLWLIVNIFLTTGSSYGQQRKRILDTAALSNFPTHLLSGIRVSPDGRFTMCEAATTLGAEEEYRKVTVKTLDGKWERVIDNAQGLGKFSDDSKYCLLSLSRGNLCLLPLDGAKEELIKGVDSYELFPGKAKEQYLLINKKSASDSVIIRNLSTGHSFGYSHMSRVLFLPGSKTIVFSGTRDGLTRLFRERLGSGKRELLWSGDREIRELVSDGTADRIAFSTGSGLWYYNGDNNKVLELPVPKSQGFEGLSSPSYMKFDLSGELLTFYMSETLPDLDPSVNPVDIFSYINGAFDMYKEREPGFYQCLYDTRTGKFIRLEYDGEKPAHIAADGRKVLMSKREGAGGEYYWNRKGLNEDYVLNLQDGKRIPLETVIENSVMSPGGDFVVGINDHYGDLYCLEVAKGITRNLTSGLPAPIGDGLDEYPQTSTGRGFLFSHWINNGSNLIMHDRYDIWMLDSRGSAVPVNLTNGYGRRHHIVFRAAGGDDKFERGEEIILSAYNEDTKDAGFYRIRIGSRKDPEKLSMGGYVYSGVQKASGAKIWVLKRMSAAAAPNFYWTEDFRTFHPVTSEYPERKYEWYTTELFDYTTKDGVKSQGILYKPENFDPAKKYPVLFTFYEKETKKLNEYRLPGYSSNYYFNIPMMLSRGYLVCVADIHFRIGETAHSIVDCLEGAGDHLARYSYVDSAHYGASGGSFGGYGVNCLAAFSHQFKALVPIAGVSDLVSAYGNVPGTRDELVENRHGRMGVSLSTDPERYLRNSPVAYAKDVTSPVLIINTLADGNVNVQQGIEWFISLRREGKPAWLLRYRGDEANHGIWNWNDQKDLYTRMNQFFDHYLKGAPAPVWMTGEIGVKDRGVRSGFEVNPGLTSPPPGLLRVAPDTIH